MWILLQVDAHMYARSRLPVAPSPFSRTINELKMSRFVYLKRLFLSRGVVMALTCAPVWHH